MKKINCLAILVAAMAVAVPAAPVLAQAFPSKPIG